MGNRRSAVLVLCCALMLTACQLADRAPDAAATGGSAATVPLGAPDQRFPQTLDALLDRAGRAALQWHDGAVPVEITVQLEQDGWRSAEVIYLTADSDRFLRVDISPTGSEQTRPTLSTLSLQPVDEAGIARIPPLPKRMLDHADLLAAAADALARCGVGPRASRILYSTGAPFAWNGTRWTQKLAWTATITDDTRLLVVDPVSGEPMGKNACVGAAR